MKKVVIYGTAVCPYCIRAKQLLEGAGVAYEEIRIDTDPISRQTMEQRIGRKTVPQIFIGDHHVGGYDDLKKIWDTEEFFVLLKD